MNVVIVGGYGVFGSLIARLLMRDGHNVWLAGRTPHKALSVAKDLGALAIERNVDASPNALFDPKPDILVDAAGPFQQYGADCYRIPKMCIEAQCHYLDLSDASEFTKGISQLDAAARAAGVFVLSGASSVPGVSSSVATDLAVGFDSVDLIDTVILPGNKAPRGRSVIESITGGVGHEFKVLRGGKWRPIAGWTDKRFYRLSRNLKRPAYAIDVPDLKLLLEKIAAQSVTFRAGLELGIMNAALSLLARARRFAPFKLPSNAISLLHAISKALFPFGSDRGGMQVSVVGTVNGSPVLRQWTLIAEKGDGPFVPALICRAVARQPDLVKPGARACLAELPRDAIECAMSGLAITTQVTMQDHPTLFAAALRDRWDKLPNEVRALHSVQDLSSFSGTAAVTRGSSLIARVAAWCFGFPQESPNAKITITKTRVGKSEIWERNFDGKLFRSHCSPSPSAYRYRERFGPFKFEQDLPVADDSLHLPVRRGWFLGVPLPSFLLPRSESREYGKNGKFHFDVSLSAPLGGGLIVRYRGSLSPDGQSSSEAQGELT
ncbi:MAG: DUF4166 domain-containing protein [Pseudomonadota bacterium]